MEMKRRRRRRRRKKKRKSKLVLSEVGDAPSDKGDLTRSLKSLTRRTEMALA